MATVGVPLGVWEWLRSFRLNAGISVQTCRTPQRSQDRKLLKRRELLGQIGGEPERASHIPFGHI